MSRSFRLRMSSNKPFNDSSSSRSPCLPFRIERRRRTLGGCAGGACCTRGRLNGRVDLVNSSSSSSEYCTALKTLGFVFLADFGRPLVLEIVGVSFTSISTSTPCKSDSSATRVLAFPFPFGLIWFLVDNKLDPEEEATEGPLTAGIGEHASSFSVSSSRGPTGGHLGQCHLLLLGTSSRGGCMQSICQPVK